MLNNPYFGGIKKKKEISIRTFKVLVIVREREWLKEGAQGGLPSTDSILFHGPGDSYTSIHFMINNWTLKKEKKKNWISEVKEQLWVFVVFTILKESAYCSVICFFWFDVWVNSRNQQSTVTENKRGIQSSMIISDQDKPAIRDSTNTLIDRQCDQSWNHPMNQKRKYPVINY